MLATKQAALALNRPYLTIDTVTLLVDIEKAVDAIRHRMETGKFPPGYDSGATLDIVLAAAELQARGY